MSKIELAGEIDFREKKTENFRTKLDLKDHFHDVKGVVVVF